MQDVTRYWEKIMLSWLAHPFVICKTHAFAAKKALCVGEKKKLTG